MYFIIIKTTLSQVPMPWHCKEKHQPESPHSECTTTGHPWTPTLRWGLVIMKNSVSTYLPLQRVTPMHARLTPSLVVVILTPSKLTLPRPAWKEFRASTHPDRGTLAVPSLEFSSDAPRARNPGFGLNYVFSSAAPSPKIQQGIIQLARTGLDARF